MNFTIIQKSNGLYLRLTSGRYIDYSKKLQIICESQNWDKKNEKIKSGSNKDVINSKLLQLKAYVIEKYNEDNLNGETIDSQWLEKKINIFFNRQEVTEKPKHEKIYFINFCNWWLEQVGPKWKTVKGEYIADRALQQYNVFVNTHLWNYLKSNNQTKIKIKEITATEIQDFADYMFKEKYSFESIKRHINRFKFFINRAEALNLEVNKNFKDRIIVNQNKHDEITEVYLNETEIKSIYNLDLSKDEELDNIRDNFIIGLYTGLRISDFNNNLKTDNIKNDYIEIRTKKTKTWTAIPLHSFVKEILNKRFGNLPTKTTDNRFNEVVKILCYQAKINQITEGTLFDPKTKRNKIGYYEKYKLVSSHICRRSFATNLFGKVPNHVIQAVGGWASEQMMLHYIKKTNREHAEQLKEYWDKEILNNLK